MYLRISLSSLALANLGAMAGLVMMLRCGGTDLKGEVAGLISWPVTQIPHKTEGECPISCRAGEWKKGEEEMRHRGESCLPRSQLLSAPTHC